MQTRANHPFQPPQQDLVLIGGGHSHALVLLDWAMRPVPGVRLTLISEQSYSPYSGMLPGLVAGHYQVDDIHYDLRNLCRHAGARFIQARVSGLDPEQQQIKLEGRPALEYDLLSINAGAVPDWQVAGARQYSIPVKPISGFWQRWQAARATLLEADQPQHIVLVGGGAGSVELALCMRTALQQARVQHPISLITRGPEPVADYPKRMKTALATRLQQQQINVISQFNVAEVSAKQLHSQQGHNLDYDYLFWCTQARAAPWPGESSLVVNEQGFIRVHPTLSSLNYPNIFAAGDIAWIDQHPLPRAGVYAVRQGKILAANLKAKLAGQPLRPYRPQRHFLSLLACGNQDAVGAKGRLSLAGPWVWRLKDHIDRRFMRMLQQLPVLPPPRSQDDISLEPPAMRCGGCAGKVGASVLQQALNRMQQPEHCQLTAAPGRDDAAVISWPASPTKLVQSLDVLKPLVDDPYLFARLTTLHALSDLYAMHAQPHSAQLLVQLQHASESLQVRDMQQLLAGVEEELQRAGAELLGGHTLEGEQMQLGLCVNGQAQAQQLIGKQGLQAGDLLVLSKPLGSGALFAAAMRGAARGDWISQALDTLLQSNAQAAELFAQHQAHALTDITGFGLLGHLQEMLGHQGAELWLAQLPSLPGALEVLQQGYHSTLSPANRRLRHLLQPAPELDTNQPRYALLFDPQTCGGLLAAIAPQHWPDLQQASSQAGQPLWLIGKVTEQHGIHITDQAG